MTPLRILHLPDVVGGHPTALAKGETANGANSKSLSYLNSPFGYEADIQLRYVNSPAPLRWAERIQQFLKIRSNFDVFHFNFGSSLLNSASNKLRLSDLPHYPNSSAKLMTYQGSDCRTHLPPEYDVSRRMELECGYPVDKISSELSLNRKMQIQRSVEKAETHCDQIFALNPDLLQFLPENKSSFLPYAISNPFLDKAANSPRSWESGKPLHIVHLSTSRVLKGTGLIEKALKEAAKSIGITYEIVFRQPRTKALSKMVNADLVIDQVVLGWYGATAVEAMYGGIPVAGFVAAEHLKLLPKQMARQLPVINTPIEQITEMIYEVNRNREILKKAAEEGIKFANQWHDPCEVAHITLAIYEKILKKKRQG